MNPSTKNSHVDWAELDANILHIICIKLVLIFDFIHFRAVCKRWRSATTPSDLPLQFPLLLESHDGRRDTKLDVFSLQTHKIYTLDVPQIRGKYLAGPSHGYLLAYRSGKTPSPCLLNPFTGSQLHLRLTKYNFFNPVHLGPKPTREVGDAIIYMVGPEVKPNGNATHYVGYWDSEKKKWTTVEVPYGKAMAYYKERLYLYDHKTHVINISTGEVLSDIRSPAGVYFSDLIVTPGGLLGVDRLFPFNSGGKRMENCCFEVYRLEDEDEKPHWMKLSNIGDLMIFIDSNNGFCLSASDFDGFKGNCIYFLRSNDKTGRNSRSYVGRYDLGENRSEVVACTRSGDVWIVPSLC
ncbi:putative F-box protein At2g16290 [Carex rostrata]